MEEIKKLEVFRMKVTSDMWSGKACVRTRELRSEW